MFAELGEEVYDDYWMFYLTADMAKALEIKRPYINLKTYLEYKERGINILEKHSGEIKKLGEEDDSSAEQNDVDES